MNRREVLTGAIGTLGSLAMMQVTAADETDAKPNESSAPFAIKTCPVYMCINNGSYWTYYAMESTEQGGSPCSNAKMLIGPPNLGLGCPNGGGCVSSVAARSVSGVTALTGSGDDVAFHGNLELDGAPGEITFPRVLPYGVYNGRIGKYKLTGSNGLKKGDRTQADDADIILREIIILPQGFFPNPGTANQPARIFYFAQEVAVGTIVDEVPEFGSIKKVAKLKADGHHFRIKLKKNGQGGGDPGDSDREFDFTLLARRKP